MESENKILALHAKFIVIKLQIKSLQAYKEAIADKDNKDNTDYAVLVELQTQIDNLSINAKYYENSIDIKLIKR